jgi:hypothetical protein
MAIQQMLLGVGAKDDPVYIDDCFSTYLYTGTGSAINIVNGLNNLEKGGLIWVKNRGSNSDGHYLVDTVRGNNKNLRSDKDDDEETLTGVSSFNNNGFSITSSSMGPFNSAGDKYATWNWRNSPMFQVVQWTGNGSNREISHSLGSVPGFMLCKRYSSPDEDWAVYHRSLGNGKTLILHTDGGVATSSNTWNDTTPTASVFSLGSNARVNTDGEDYIGYLFAGGESTNALARSVDMDGTGDYINTTSSSSDFTMGTGDFTVECWVKADTNERGIFQISSTSGGLTSSNVNDTMALWIDTTFRFTAGGSDHEGAAKAKVGGGHWIHVAYVRNSGTTSLYVDGILDKSVTDNTNYNGTYIAVGAYEHTDYVMDGSISNFRVVKGTAVYTSSFRPPTEPLTNITNTKLLCCNDSSVTGSTVTPVTLNSQGDPTASTDSPFDDPAGFKFGDTEDQNVVKCGIYKGNSSTDFEVNLGWEPQFIMIKRTDTSANWSMFDSMRGIVSKGDDERYLFPNLTNAEYSAERLTLTSTGFIVDASAGVLINANNGDYIYVAIRRSDGYVGKPYGAGEGTSVFAMDTGAGTTTIPNYDSGFPVDMSLRRQFASSDSWVLGSRLMGGKILETNDTDAEQNAGSAWAWDSNVGWGEEADGATYQSWMWKRHAGFDVVTYEGTGAATARNHSLGKVPEMMWIKNRGTSGKNWQVYHKGMNGGTNPEQYRMRLNTNDAEGDYGDSSWNDTAPTSSVFTVGTHSETNGSGEDYLAMLFASVEGISKVGYYDGSDSSQTITTGFQPRFVIIRNISITEDWFVLDTVRGWASGTDENLRLNKNDAQENSHGDLGDPTSTGFTVVGNNSAVNNAGETFIYYAHA